MRVGFVTQLLWTRYGKFWRMLLEEAGVEIIMPDREQTLQALESPRVAAVPGLAFKLAVAQAFSLERADVIVAPSLNAGSESQRGGGQDPWVADFPAALATLGGLPPITGVPAWLEPQQETLVIETLQQVARDPGRVRRVWDRHRAGLRVQSIREPAWGRIAAGRGTVGVVGQPWLLDDELVAKVVPDKTDGIGQHRLDPGRLRAEGSRIDPRMTPTDREVLGAARLFSRRGNVDELHLIIDESSGADLWLRDRVAKHGSKALVVHELKALLAGAGAEELLQHAPAD
ncbi:MAG: hypothetical protein WD314_01565 [Trueperaceae bacterium]